MKALFKALLTVTLLLGASASYADKTKPVSQPKPGGDSGGGGNSEPLWSAAPASLSEVKVAVQAAHILAPFVVQLYAIMDIEGGIDEKPDPMSLSLLSVQRTFKRASNVKALQSVKFKVEEAKPCLFKGKATDASADKTTNTVCMSVPELFKKKYSSRDIQKVVSSLYLHEVYHLVSEIADEAEQERLAKVVQMSTQNFIPDDAESAIDDMIAMQMELRDVLQDVENAETSFKKSENLLGLCANLTLVEAASSEVNEVMEKHTLYVQNQTGLNQSLEAFFRAVNIYGLCQGAKTYALNVNRQQVEINYPKLFVWKNEVSLYEFMDNYLEQSEGLGTDKVTPYSENYTSEFARNFVSENYFRQQRIQKLSLQDKAAIRAEAQRYFSATKAFIKEILKIDLPQLGEEHVIEGKGE